MIKKFYKSEKKDSEYKTYSLHVCLNKQKKMRTDEQKKNVDILKRFLLMIEICTYYYINMLDFFQVRHKKNIRKGKGACDEVSWKLEHVRVKIKNSITSPN